MAVSEWEIAARAFEPPPIRWATPGDLAQHLTPDTIQTRALDLVDEALVRAFNTPDSRLIITLAPQEGKSTRVASDFPIWALAQNANLRIITASYGQGLANRNGRLIRNRITKAPELELRVAADHGAASEWSIDGHRGGVKSVGIGAGITGYACDLMVIDDPIKSWSEAYSEVYRENIWDWWRTEAASRLAPGASVILILTRWHHDDLAGRLVEQGENWRVLNIPAQCEDPETDPLGRQADEFLDSARRRTTAQWEMRKREAGPLGWASQYQGRPTPETGNILPSGAWSFYDVPMWLDRDDGTRVVPEAGRDEFVEIAASWDLAFKGDATSDFVVGQVWLRNGPNAYLLDQVRGRWNFTQTCQQIRALSAKWPQALAKYVEDKANGPAVMNSLRAQVRGLIPVEPEGSKIARVHAIAPLVHAKNVHLPAPEMAPWVGDLVQEAAAFPATAHDDQVDALSQAVHRLLLVPLLDGRILDAADLLEGEEDLDLSWATTDY
jgi:predicted phage terminase large subunit-like protein